MKIDLNKKLTNLNGNSIKDQEGKDFTIRYYISGELISESGCEDPLRNWKLADKIYNNTEQFYETNKEEIEFIERVVKKSNSSILIKGYVLDYINNIKKE